MYSNELRLKADQNETKIPKERYISPDERTSY